MANAWDRLQERIAKALPESPDEEMRRIFGELETQREFLNSQEPPRVTLLGRTHGFGLESGAAICKRLHGDDCVCWARGYADWQDRNDE
jgi:hypothetical protein